MICPKCGHEFDPKGPINYSSKIRELISKRSVKTKKAIKKIVTVTKPTPKEVFDFLILIRDVSDNIVDYMVNQFYIEGYYLKKPLKYLASMIKNYDKNKDKMLEVERQIYGTKPPIKGGNI